MERIAPPQLSEEEQSYLLDAARSALRAHLAGEPAPAVDEEALSDALKTEAACFVTLTVGGRLRGCILDSFVPHESIVRNVMRNVVLAATGDPRFPPVTIGEFESIAIEISALGRSYAIAFDDPEELAAALRPGLDGVILTTTFGSSTYLPQVWEQIPDPEQFLTELCRKHGAPGDAWRTGDLLRVEVYQVTHFAEGEGASTGSGGD